MSAFIIKELPIILTWGMYKTQFEHGAIVAPLFECVRGGYVRTYDGKFEY